MPANLAQERIDRWWWRRCAHCRKLSRILEHCACPARRGRMPMARTRPCGGVVFLAYSLAALGLEGQHDVIVFDHHVGFQQRGGATGAVESGRRIHCRGGSRCARSVRSPADSANSRVGASPDRCIETLRRIFEQGRDQPRQPRCALRCSRTFSQSASIAVLQCRPAASHGPPACRCAGRDRARIAHFLIRPAARPLEFRRSDGADMTMIGSCRWRGRRNSSCRA